MDTIGLTNIRLGELVAAAALKPMLRQRQRETERNRRVSDDTVAQIKAAGCTGAPASAFWSYEHDLWTFARCAADRCRLWVYRLDLLDSGRAPVADRQPTIGHRPSLGRYAGSDFCLVVFAGGTAVRPIAAAGIREVAVLFGY